jgi:hypothetical protein
MTFPEILNSLTMDSKDTKVDNIEDKEFNRMINKINDFQGNKENKADNAVYE